MTFGEYIKHRRKHLGYNQDQLEGFGQSYISSIESGSKRPTKRDTIALLAQSLQLKADQVDWLWAYSLFDRDPFEYFGKHRPARVYESENGYFTGASSSEIIIPEGASMGEVRSKLGEPDLIFRSGDKHKWIYKEHGIHVNFEDDHVFEVLFK